LEQCLDFIVIAQERDKQVRRAVLKDETQRNTSPALEKLVSQFTNSEAAVHVRLAKRIR